MIIPFDIIKDAHGNEVMMLKTFDYTYDVRDGAQFYFENLYHGVKYLSKYQTLLKLIHSFFYFLYTYINKRRLYYTNIFIKSNIFLGDNMHIKMHQNWKLLTISYGTYLFDPLTKKIFDSFRNYVRFETLKPVSSFDF